jgi:hypothetical protein
MVTQVRRYHSLHRHHHGHRGRNLAIGLGIGIVGGMIAAEAYRGQPSYYDDAEVDGLTPGYAGDPRASSAPRGSALSNGIRALHDLLG